MLTKHLISLLSAPHEYNDMEHIVSSICHSVNLLYTIVLLSLICVRCAGARKPKAFEIFTDSTPVRTALVADCTGG